MRALVVTSLSCYGTLELRNCLRIIIIIIIISDSVSLSRLSANGYQVIDRPRPRQSTNTLSTNYGSVTAVAIQGIRLTRIDLEVATGTFELLCVRVVSGSSSCVVAAVYRPGSVTVTAASFL